MQGHMQPVQEFDNNLVRFSAGQTAPCVIILTYDTGFDNRDTGIFKTYKL